MGSRTVILFVLVVAALALLIPALVDMRESYMNAILISPREGEVFQAKETLRITWTSGEEVQRIYLIPLEVGCDIEKVGLVSGLPDPKGIDSSGCMRIGLYADIVGDPVNTSGELSYELSDIGHMLEADEYYIMLITPANEFDLGGPFHIQKREENEDVLNILILRP